ncbi:MAG: Rrf2 family transcriptional regulator [Saprospiraceae bacterium]|nr:Rrf2 family transcriptional regulator [Saprospiraceae bacterium]
MFSKACEYGIRATIYIASQSRKERRVGIKEIAAFIDSPAPFTAKILQQLVKNRIIDSVKGPNGGFEIPKDRIFQICITDIVRAIDGNEIFSSCVLGLDNCSEAMPCPVHAEFRSIRAELKSLMDNTCVATLSEDLVKGKSFLKV